VIAIHPITIVGGGLSGLSLGVALCNAGVPTTIFEAGEYPRHRVCGEFITGLGAETIEKLGIGPALAAAGSHHRVTWHLRDRAIGRQLLPSPARTVSRYALDARLAEMFVARGGRLTTHTRFKPTLDEAGTVRASGRKSCGASPWFGLKLHARNLATTDDLEFFLGDGAYVGMSTVEDGWTNICGLFRRRPELQFDRDDALSTYLRASGLATLDERLKSANIRPGSRCAVAGIVCDSHVTEEDGVRLGDACAMIPPFTGNGMAMAFTSAALALDPLVAWARGDFSWSDTARNIRESLRGEFRLRLASASFLHHFLLSDTLQPCLGAAMRSGLLPLTTLYRLLH
jgi:flavin-dependent dehydrogenase